MPSEDAIITFSGEDLRIASANRGACESFGYAPAEFHGLNLPDLFAGDPSPTGADEIHAALENSVALKDVVGLRADGQTFPMDVSFGRTPIASVCVAAFRDLTARREHDEELLRAREAAEAANDAKSKFLANMSHELRTPMTSIIGFGEILMEDAVEKGDDSTQEDLKRIVVAARNLLDLINSLLDFSKIEAGKMVFYPETFEVSRLIDEIEQLIQPLVKAGENTLEVHQAEDLGQIRSDRQKIFQSVMNLLANACKFTDRGTITLSARRELEEGSERLVISVADTGIGIAPENFDRIFESFRQADGAANRRHGGTGLGLSLSRRYCKMMGGDITVESVLGEGSVFAVHIPTRFAVKSDGSAIGVVDSAAIEARPDRTGKFPVMLIDDDIDSQALVRRILDDSDYVVSGATSRTDWRATIEQWPPSAVIIDTMMAEADGWAIVHELREDPAYRELPVIILTAEDAETHGGEVGARVLRKPIDRTRLLETLDACREERR